MVENDNSLKLAMPRLVVLMGVRKQNFSMIREHFVYAGFRPEMSLTDPQPVYGAPTYHRMILFSR